MAKRKSIPRRKSRRMFRKTAGKTNWRNVTQPKPSFRGGIRL